MGGSHDGGHVIGGGESRELGQSRDQRGHDAMEGNGGSHDKGSCDRGGSRDRESNVTENNGGHMIGSWGSCDLWQPCGWGQSRDGG